ncbi:MAG TPA: hypothetical protein VFW96_02555 [Thermomicrobiales bacterium]|nr:hypothetical protein [Thermomicrobiales bacterium]
MTMSRVAAHAQFALHGGQRLEECPQLLLDEVVDAPGGARDYLSIICEPMELRLHALRAGAGVLAAIRDAYLESDRADPVAALAAAVDAANDVLYTRNRAGAPEKRVFLGVTCLVVRDHDLIVCQVPPTQVVIAQNGTPIALPELASWHEYYQPREQDGPYGLGLHAEALPLLYRAALEPGDLLTLCSSNLAALLPEDDLGPVAGDDPAAARDYLAALAERHHLDDAYAAVLAPPLPEVMAGVAGAPQDPAWGRRAGWDDEDGAPSLAPERGPLGAGWFERSLREMRERARVISWPLRHGQGGAAPVVPLRGRPAGATADDQDYEVVLHHVPADAADQGAAGPLRFRATADDDRFALRRHGPAPAAGGARFAAGGATGYGDDDPGYGEDDDEDPAPRGRYAGGAAYAAEDDGAGEDLGDDADYDEPDAGDLAGEDDDGRYAVPRRAASRQPLLGAGALLALAFGGLFAPRGRRSSHTGERLGKVWPLGSLERWDQRRRPRFTYWMPLAIAGLIGVLVVALVFSVRGHQTKVAADRFDAALAQVTRGREAAVASRDRVAAHTQLLDLRTRLGAIPVDGHPAWQERVAAEGVALAQALDKVDGVQRLAAGQIALLATAPVPPGSTAQRPQIVLGANGQQFVLLGDTVYAVDGKAKTLAKALGKGDNVAGVTVGPLLGIAWRIDKLLAFDDSHGYIRDASGAWTALPLGASGFKPAAGDTFDGNLYLLAPDRNQIVKFASGDYAAAPQPWSSTAANGDLALAVDMSIDKDIYVLLSDGRVLDFFQGEVKGTYTPTAVPPLAGATALYAAPDGKYLFAVDPREGRIVRLGRDGAVLATYKAADGAPSFAGAREITVDEAANIAYVLTDQGLLAVHLPPPPQ